MADVAERLRARCRSLQATYRYREVLLVDAAGKILFRVRSDAEGGREVSPQTLAEVSRHRQPLLTELHAHGDEVTCLAALVPLYAAGGAAAEPVAAAVLQTDARQFLDPLIQSWPTASRSAEVLLVRREGDTVLYLNELRHRRGTALRLRIPLAQTNTPSVAR